MTDQPEALRLADALVRPDDSRRLADGNYLMPQAAAELRRLHAELAAAEYALRSKGYRKSCEISACNCGDQWSHGGNAEARLRELSSELHGSPVDMNGKTLLAGLTELIERAEKAEAEAERLRAELSATTERLVHRAGTVYALCAETVRLEAERDEARAELSACADERNNYSRILTVLGMEEEGDPVAEVDALMQERDQLHEARAELARLTKLRPASEWDGATLVLAMHRQGTRQRLTRHLEPWECWVPLPDVKETK